MPSALKLDGRRYGKLTVIKRHAENNADGSTQWECLCDCGNTKIVKVYNLTRGRARCCGCTLSVTFHGHSSSPEYKAWKDMKDRCYNENNEAYINYGGRGITVCDAWKNDFMAFYNDMGPRPTNNCSLDRKDNNLSYYKDNCRWATRAEQNNNKRNNTYYEYNGNRKTLMEWCQDLGLKYYKVHYRLRKGWTFEEAIQPIEDKLITYDDTTNRLQDWCDLMDLDPLDTYIKILLGTPFEDIVSA